MTLILWLLALASAVTVLAQQASRSETARIVTFVLASAVAGSMIGITTLNLLLAQP